MRKVVVNHFKIVYTFTSFITFNSYDSEVNYLIKREPSFSKLHKTKAVGQKWVKTLI